MNYAREFQAVAHATSMATQAAMGKAESRPAATALAIGGASGALSVLAVIVSQLPGDLNAAKAENFDPGKRITSDSLLFAALLTVSCIAPLHSSLGDDGSTSVCEQAVDFSPCSIMSAMELFEKLTGRAPDSFLNPAMVMAARESTKESADMLAKFLKGGTQSLPH